MRSMKPLSSSSPGTVWIVLRIFERAIIEGCNRRVWTPISAVRNWPVLGISAGAARLSNSGTDTRPNAGISEPPRKASAGSVREAMRLIFSIGASTITLRA
jgi:hypothetical protein